MKVTGWFTTDARSFMPCPKCDVVAGEDCRTPKGRKAINVHKERVGLLLKKCGRGLWAGPITSAAQIVEENRK